MKSFTDQCGNTIRLQHTPQRIISLVPSQTELLFDLGLDETVRGITKFCVHPDSWFRTKQRVGGTKQLHTDIINEINPDLIIANKEENDREQVELLARKYPVWVSDIKTLDDALEMIGSVGAMTGKEANASVLVNNISNGFSQLQFDNIIPVAYFIWQNPFMVAGGDTFINDMLRKAGFENIFQSHDRYPEIDMETLRASGCQHVMLSSEPFPFAQKHIDHLQKELPGLNFYLVDGEMFSWYGSRLLHAPPYFRQLRQTVLQIA